MSLVPSTCLCIPSVSTCRCPLRFPIDPSRDPLVLSTCSLWSRICLSPSCFLPVGMSLLFLPLCTTGAFYLPLPLCRSAYVPVSVCIPHLSVSLYLFCVPVSIFVPVSAVFLALLYLCPPTCLCPLCFLPVCAPVSVSVPCAFYLYMSPYLSVSPVLSTYLCPRSCLCLLYFLLVCVLVPV